MTLIALFVVLIFLYSTVSGRLERTVVTAPIVFTTAGLVIFLFLPGLQTEPETFEWFLRVAEIGLVLLLFTDASRTELSLLKSFGNLPVRLLTTGMLLTILLGALGALAVFPYLTLWEAGILAAVLAPTDAGLGQIIVNSPRVPIKIRQALNVEAGLNDGLSVPFLLFFIALSTAESHDPRLSRLIIEQLGFGAAIGIAIGFFGAWLLNVAKRKEWMTESWLQLGIVSLPLLCALASEVVHASMFIAAFVAGLAAQIKFKGIAKHSVEFTEEWGQLLNLSVFFLFGLLIAQAWSRFHVSLIVYALLSLTVVRMLPVAIALRGTRLSRATVLFMGWFGPRGLASIVLGLIYVEETTHASRESTIPMAVMMTVLLSIFAHGFSALPGMKAYEKQVNKLEPNAPEHGVLEKPHD